jgi:hypothetical protein
MFWVHRDSVTLKACFHARVPQLFSPSHRLSKERPLPSHPNLRRLLLGVASHPTPLAQNLSARALPTRGFGPRHDITRSRPTHSRCIPSTTTSFRPQAVSASRRFPPRSRLQACFIPQPCSGPILFRGSIHSAQPCFLVENRVPPCRCRRSALRSPGVHKNGASASRLCSTRRCDQKLQRFRLQSCSLPSSGSMLLEAPLFSQRTATYSPLSTSIRGVSIAKSPTHSFE